MTRLGLILLLLLAICLSGCRRRASNKDASAPLSVEEWQVMPAQEKFTFQAMERLKRGNPKFQDDSEWDNFARTVFMPAQQLELPNGPPPK